MKVEEGPRLTEWWVQGSGPKKYVSILQKSQVLGTAEIGAGKSRKGNGAAGSGHVGKSQGCHAMEYELPPGVNRDQMDN